MEQWLGVQTLESQGLGLNPASTASQLCDLGPRSRQSLCTSVSQSVKEDNSTCLTGLLLIGLNQLVFVKCFGTELGR